MSEEKNQVLTAKQKKYLKGLAHPLSALVQIGKDGLSSGLVRSTRKELLNHELIKVRIGNNSGLEKHGTAEILAGKTNSTLVQLIGKTIVLYRANPKKPRDKRISLPKV